MRADYSYALWVRSSDGSWSNAVKINDARPLWITPPYVHQNTAVASLPRELKVIGRNLQPPSEGMTRVRLTHTSGSNYVLDAANNHLQKSSIEHYVAKVSLPPGMPLGSYNLHVTRDGRSWVPIEGQTRECSSL
jgi:hypothetical protein